MKNLSYPLYFAFKQVVAGKDFRALIEAKGKVLMAEEDDQYWLYGVQPGGMAACGETIKKGLKNFDTAFKNVLLDTAAESTTADEFKQEARNFFSAIDETEAKTWEAARKELKSEKTKSPEEISGLRKETSDLDCTIDIVLIRKHDVLNIKKKDILSRDDLYRCAA